MHPLIFATLLLTPALALPVAQSNEASKHPPINGGIGPYSSINVGGAPKDALPQGNWWGFVGDTGSGMGPVGARPPHAKRIVVPEIPPAGWVKGQGAKAMGSGKQGGKAHGWSKRDEAGADFTEADDAGADTGADDDGTVNGAVMADGTISFEGEGVPSADQDA
ncbi:hypothetical protein EJ06DRAFT_523713 [Trichodelitschia bisporula]|uniref:Uncharacterized protein n=1 Tax=Trichodelitschia bisporula TaxID=703511 RepID=A0A6G1HPG5_9PEZI|nr:hypothetical protein EJ06DRAFT_523713 [Trichodelitschia bisporula]